MSHAVKKIFALKYLKEEAFFHKEVHKIAPTYSLRRSYDFRKAFSNLIDVPFYDSVRDYVVCSDLTIANLTLTVRQVAFFAKISVLLAEVKLSFENFFVYGTNVLQVYTS